MLRQPPRALGWVGRPAEKLLGLLLTARFRRRALRLVPQPTNRGVRAAPRARGRLRCRLRALLLRRRLRASAARAGWRLGRGLADGSARWGQPAACVASRAPSPRQNAMRLQRGSKGAERGRAAPPRWARRPAGSAPRRRGRGARAMAARLPLSVPALGESGGCAARSRARCCSPPAAGRGRAVAERAARPARWRHWKLYPSQNLAFALLRWSTIPPGKSLAP